MNRNGAAGSAKGGCVSALSQRSAEDSSVVAEVPAALASYIATRDRRIAKNQPWAPSPLREHFEKLIRHGIVTVGGRASCGGTTDPTWVEFTSWNEIVRKAKSFGFDIEVTPVKHGNGWATKCGGFWNENEYRYVNAPRIGATK